VCVRSSEDLRRGYFDDMRDLKQDGGKQAPAAATLTPAATAMPFPSLPLLRPDGAPGALPPPHAAATLVALLARAGAQRALDTWTLPFAARFCAGGSSGGDDAADARDADVALVQLALVESTVMALPGLRSVILRGSGSDASATHAATQRLYHFGDGAALRKQLTAPNKMAAYVFLLDAAGRVRWRGSGLARQEEVGHMLACTAALLAER
jgi:hypothetical protein